jgi:hypothetical protein
MTTVESDMSRQRLLWLPSIECPHVSPRCPTTTHPIPGIGPSHPPNPADPPLDRGGQKAPSGPYLGRCKNTNKFNILQTHRSPFFKKLTNFASTCDEIFVQRTSRKEVSMAKAKQNAAKSIKNASAKSEKASNNNITQAALKKSDKSRSPSRPYETSSLSSFCGVK